MLELLAKHGFFDLTVHAKGDLDIDEHHTVEDVGIVMGKALHQALGEKAGIKRFGFSSAPLDETLAQVTIDLSGRPFLVYNVNLPDRKIKAFDLGLFEDFFQAFVTHGGLNLHVNLLYGRNPHHIMEATSKPRPRPWIRRRCWRNDWQEKCFRPRGRLTVLAPIRCRDPAAGAWEETASRHGWGGRVRLVRGCS